MSQKRTKLETLIASQSGPITRAQIRKDLAALGVQRGMTVLAHTSVSSVGWVPGGAATIALCVRDVLGPEGTLVVPTQSSDLSDPIHWSRPPIPESWFEETKATMAPFDKHSTPSSGQGVFPEIVRNFKDALRSDHPHTSFAAIGARAYEITCKHVLESPLGPGSPLQKLYDLDASVLFLGTTFETNTCFHLAEENQPDPPKETQGAPMIVDGKEQWVSFECTEYETDDFVACGEAFEAAMPVQTGSVGQAQSKLFRVRNAVDFAITWFKNTRNS